MSTRPNGRKAAAATKTAKKSAKAAKAARAVPEAVVDLGSVSTDTDGRFRYHAEATQSHTLRFTRRASTATVEIRVPGRLSFRARPRSVINGEAVTFRGRVLGQITGNIRKARHSAQDDLIGKPLVSELQRLGRPVPGEVVGEDVRQPALGAEVAHQWLTPGERRARHARGA